VNGSAANGRNTVETSEQSVGFVMEEAADEVGALVGAVHEQQVLGIGGSSRSKVIGCEPIGHHGRFTRSAAGDPTR
jgi:hypothetical protein